MKDTYTHFLNSSDNYITYIGEELILVRSGGLRSDKDEEARDER